jgi:hypothetical protein
VPFVILSRSERGLWSKEMGWVTGRALATVFRGEEIALPATKGHDARWVPLDEAEEVPEIVADLDLRVGDEVFWRAPEGQASGDYTVLEVGPEDERTVFESDVVVLTNAEGAYCLARVGELK